MRNPTYYFPSSATFGDVRKFFAERGIDFTRMRLIFERTAFSNRRFPTLQSGQHQYTAEAQGSEQHERTDDPMG